MVWSTLKLTSDSCTKVRGKAIHLGARIEIKMSTSIFKSKTFWVNGLTAAISFGAFLGGQQMIVDNPQIVAIGGAALGIGNIVLALIQKDPLHLWQT